VRFADEFLSGGGGGEGELSSPQFCLPLRVGGGGRGK